MTAALIAAGAGFLAAIGYSIWSRIRIGRLYKQIQVGENERNTLVGKIDTLNIELATSASNLDAVHKEKQRLDAVNAKLRKEIDDVLELVRQGKLTNTDAVRHKLDELLSK